VQYGRDDSMLGEVGKTGRRIEEKRKNPNLVN